MDTLTPEPNFFQRNRILFKGIVMGFLILVMIIPTVLVNNLVYERKTRQREIVREVSEKWSGAQTIAGPYLYVPYKIVFKTTDGKDAETTSYFWILPEVLNVSGTIDHQLRKRSIYNVLLYKANLKHTGSLFSFYVL